MGHPVKWLHSGMSNAPVLNGLAGSLIGVLDACLNSGWGLIQASSATYDSGTGRVTLNFPSAHGFTNKQIVLVAGATQTEYNGEQRVDTLTTNTISYIPQSVPTVTPATGTVTCKVAPLWGSGAKLFSGTNKAVYKPIAVGASGCCLRVDGTNTLYSLVRSYESMTDCDTGVGPSPKYDQVNGGLLWKSSSSATSTGRNWWIVGDDRLFYLGLSWHEDYLEREELCYFGDFNSFKAGDAFACMIGGALSNERGYPSYYSSTINFNKVFSSEYISRSFSQVGSSVGMCKVGSRISDLTGAGGFSYPDAISNGLLISQVNIIESNINGFRGALPGLYQCLQESPGSHLDIVEGIDGVPGDVLLLRVAVPAGGWGGSAGRIAFDIKGPWR